MTIKANIDNVPSPDGLVGTRLVFKYGDRERAVGEVVRAADSYDGIDVVIRVSDSALEEWIRLSPKALDWIVSV